MVFKREDVDKVCHIHRILNSVVDTQ